MSNPLQCVKIRVEMRMLIGERLDELIAQLSPATDTKNEKDLAGEGKASI